jgi:hypothetical protein
MKSQPITPYFLFDRSKHFIDLCDTTEIGKRVSRLTLITEWDSHCIAYDSTGIAWGFRFEGQKAKHSWFDRLLAEIYNPAQETSVVWFSFTTIP